VSALGAPLALIVDAVSYVLSAGNLAAFGGATRASTAGEAQGHGRRVREGLRVTFGHPILGRLPQSGDVQLLPDDRVALLLYLARAFGLGAATIGILFAVRAVGSLVGSLLAGPLARRFGLGRTIVGSMVLGCAARRSSYRSPAVRPLRCGARPVDVLGASASARTCIVSIARRPRRPTAGG
jgi:hypothetical protein